MKKKRNYAWQKKKNAEPAEIKKRSSRNKARRKLKKAGVKIAGKDVHHKDGNANNNKRSNIVAKSSSKNRSFARTKTARKKKK
jgi:hypothetical protein